MGFLGNLKDSLTGSSSKGSSDFDGGQFDSNFSGNDNSNSSGNPGNPGPGKQGQNPGAPGGNPGTGGNDMGRLGGPQAGQGSQGPPGQPGPDQNQGPGMGDDIGLDSPSPGGQGMDQGGPGGNQGQPEPGRDADMGGQNPAPSPGGQGGGMKDQPSNDLDSPNPQAGRPQRGASEPQVSNQTREKLESAGFEFDNRGSGGGGGGNRQDFEEIKSQNQQIIDLLQEINDSLSSQDRSRGGRHAGRR